MKDPEQSLNSQSYQQTCLCCGETLTIRQCKLTCPRCGYTEDCSDAGLVDYGLVEVKPKRRPQTSRPPRTDKAQ